MGRRQICRRTEVMVPWVLLFASLSFGTDSFAQDLGEANGFAGLAVIEEHELEKLRGGDFDTVTTVQSNQELGATVIGGQFIANTLANGAITVGEGALENFSGVGLFVNNTGNGNAIDAALGVTFHLQ
ncbi:MAG: hypothetical protein ACRDGA_02715 [Bacteroidota bacterium]